MIQFKQEYITDELSSMLNVVLTYSMDTVYEEYHVILLRLWLEFSTQ